LLSQYLSEYVLRGPVKKQRTLGR